MAAYGSRATRAALALAAAVGVATSANAATLIVSNGILQGATGVNVDGTLYDVAFSTGACTALFNGCNEASDFTFTTEASSLLAARALLDQVFIDGPLGQFDTDPFLTVSCSENGSNSCLFRIPIGTVRSPHEAGGPIFASGVANYAAVRGVPRDFDRIFTNVNFPSDGDILNFAVFSNAPPITAAVPEPGTWAMMLLGFGFVGGAMRGSKRRQKIVSHA